MKEESLKAPTRHPIEWNTPDFLKEESLLKEMERVFDICHGCRRCFNLCDSFPRLFDLIDASETGELDSVPSEKFSSVVEACTLCDMCFMTKCPYVPPHSFNIDFPHLMLRARAVERTQGKNSWIQDQIASTDRNAKLASPIAPVVNWANQTNKPITRPLLEKVTGIDRRAALPQFHQETFLKRAQTPPPLNKNAPAFGEKILIYATCFVNYNNPNIGEATLQVLAHNGVKTEVIYPECCGMPQWEQGDIPSVAEKAQKISKILMPWIEEGYRVVPLVPSCSLMMKMEWPLLWPEDPTLKKLAHHTMDLSEYIIFLAQTKGLAPGLRPLPEGVTIHLACHARAQNQGRKGAELLQLIPNTPLQVIERCSGHGGSWGIYKENFDVALKVGRPVARQAEESSNGHCVSECPLAATHIHQGMNLLKGETLPHSFTHPIEILAYAYGFLQERNPVV